MNISNWKSRSMTPSKNHPRIVFSFLFKGNDGVRWCVDRTRHRVPLTDTDNNLAAFQYFFFHSFKLARDVS